MKINLEAFFDENRVFENPNNEWTRDMAIKAIKGEAGFFEPLCIKVTKLDRAGRSAIYQLPNLPGSYQTLDKTWYRASYLFDVFDEGHCYHLLCVRGLLRSKSQFPIGVVRDYGALPAGKFKTISAHWASLTDTRHKLGLSEYLVKSMNDHYEWLADGANSPLSI